MIPAVMYLCKTLSIRNSKAGRKRPAFLIHKYTKPAGNRFDIKKKNHNRITYITDGISNVSDAYFM